MLKKIRQQTIPIPDEHLLDRSPLAVICEQTFKDPFDKAVYSLALQVEKDTIIAVDLDDTILTNSYICTNEWHAVANAKIFKSIRYSRVKYLFTKCLEHIYPPSQRLQCNTTQYAFLRNPSVVLEIRPGMLSALKGFKDAGARLILISATDERRMDFLLKRIPFLKELFQFGNKLCIITANDILKASLDLPQDKAAINIASEEDKLSLRVHINRPMSLAMKTPYLVSKILGIGNYDVLIDDSSLSFELFQKHGLGHKMIKVNPRLPHTSYTMDIVESVIKKLRGEADITNEVEFTEKTRRRFNMKNYPHIYFEDPLYYPLIHLKDQVSINK